MHALNANQLSGHIANTPWLRKKPVISFDNQVCYKKHATSQSFNRCVVWLHNCHGTTTEEHVTSITMDPTAVLTRPAMLCLSNLWPTNCSCASKYTDRFSHLSQFNAAPFNATLLLAAVCPGSLGRADRLAVPAAAPILSLFALPMNPEALREFYENCILLTFYSTISDQHLTKALGVHYLSMIYQAMWFHILRVSMSAFFMHEINAAHLFPQGNIVYLM